MVVCCAQKKTRPPAGGAAPSCDPVAVKPDDASDRAKRMRDQ
jgi:hypothetical protein